MKNSDFTYMNVGSRHHLHKVFYTTVQSGGEGHDCLIGGGTGHTQRIGCNVSVVKGNGGK